MADPFRQKRKTGFLVVIITLALVIAFWIFHAPHTHFYRTYRLKQKLRNFSRPAETKLLDINDINTVDLPGGLVIDGVMGLYLTNMDCGSVNAHYKAEFARRGFSYVNEHDASGHDSADLGFSSSEFSARLSCTPQKAPPVLYLITMNWKTPRG